MGAQPTTTGGRAVIVRVAVTLQVVVLAWGALAFGAVYPWAYGPLVALAAVAGGVGLVAGRSVPLPHALVIAWVAVGIAVAAQLIPLPRSAIVVLSPATDRLLVEYDLLYALAARGELTGAPDALWHSLSIDPNATLRALGLWAGCGLWLVGSIRLVAVAGARPLALSLTGLGVLLAVIGIVQRATFAGKVYGFWEPLQPSSPFGPFINKNHFAGWMLMALPVALAYVCGGVAVGMRGIKPGWRRRVLWLSTPDASGLAIVAGAGLVMGLALVLTFSRSGIASFALTTALVGIAAWTSVGSHTRRMVAVGYLAVALGVAVGWAGLDRVAQRFADASWNDVGDRLGAWQDAAAIVRDVPLTGTGLNTFGTAMLFYQSQANAGLHFVQAHNDYLQLAAEGGLLIGLPVLAMLVIVVLEVRTRFREGRDRTEARWLRLGAITGFLAIAFQEVVDFSLQMPGNFVLMLLLLAIAVHRSADRGTAPSR